MIDWDIEELACLACGLTEEQKDEAINDSEVDDVLFKKYEVDFQTYAKIVKDLVKFTPVITTAISGSLVQGFVNGNCMVVKVPVKGTTT